jgi:type IV pilus assembly protein PilA
MYTRAIRSISTRTKISNLSEIHSKYKGFTLIELMITLIIVGVLSTIALPSFLNQTSKARGTEAKTMLGTMNRAQQSYRYENGLFATSIANLKVSGMAVSGRYYDFSVSGTTNTVLMNATPIQTDFKVYSSGVAIGSNDNFAQIICESLEVSGAPTDNTAIAQLTSGVSASASCTSGRVIQ